MVRIIIIISIYKGCKPTYSIVYKIRFDLLYFLKYNTIKILFGKKVDSCSLFMDLPTKKCFIISDKHSYWPLYLDVFSIKKKLWFSRDFT